LDLGAGGTGLLDRRAIRHLHFDEHLGPIGIRKELLLDDSHAEERDGEYADHAPCGEPFAANDDTKHPAKTVVQRRGVDRAVPALWLRDVRKQLHSEK